MSYQKESFGMMDEGYFVARGEIIDWVNGLLDVNMSKIQQLGSGAIYCQIVDVIHPGKVTMNKVNWKAKNQYEFINNMKILQNAFDKAGIKRYVEVEKLSKCKYQDNLEFIQWLKRYYDLNCGDRGKQYNALQRRGSTTVDFGFAQKNIVIKSFNGGGQMIAKPQLPGKKTTQVLPTKITNTEQKIESKPNVRAPEKKVTGKIQKTTNDWEAAYKRQAEKNKQLTLKLNMIEQVFQSQDKAQLKVAMLEQILGSSTSKMQVQNYNQGDAQYQDEAI